MNRLLYIPFIILFFLTTGCQEELTTDDLIHVDVSHHDSMVLSSEDPVFLDQVFEALYATEAEVMTLNHSLVYTMEVRTYDRLDSFTLVFDLDKEEAAAMNISGTYKVPFHWLESLLEAHPLPDQFPLTKSPHMTLTINGTPMTYGYEEVWINYPLGDVQWLQESSQDLSSNYKGKSTDLTIFCDFGLLPPDQVQVSIIGLKDTSTHENVSPAFLPSPEAEGAYRYEVLAQWSDPDKGFTGSITYNFGISIEKPTAYRLNKTTFEPGDPITLLIEKPIDLGYRIETETYANTIGLFYLGDNLTGIIPLSPATEPGTYSLSIYRDESNQLLQTFDYEVIPKDFNVQNLTVSTSTANLKSDDNRAKDAEKFKDAKTHSEGQMLWEGSFLQPVQGRISTEYAEYRYVNGSLTNYRHSGIDIAAPTGTPVMADNHGIVTFASDLIISGNVVVLDHGYGIFSSFVHLDEIYVEEGQHVKKGDIIAAVGSTGYSTGPHLHWGIWKNGVWLNPWKFVEEDPLANFLE